jgi:hypothetical protein
VIVVWLASFDAARSVSRTLLDLPPSNLDFETGIRVSRTERLQHPHPLQHSSKQDQRDRSPSQFSTLAAPFMRLRKIDEGAPGDHQGLEFCEHLVP